MQGEENVTLTSAPPPRPPIVDATLMSFCLPCCCREQKAWKGSHAARAARSQQLWHQPSSAGARRHSRQRPACAAAAAAARPGVEGCATRAIRRATGGHRGSSAPPPSQRHSQPAGSTWPPPSSSAACSAPSRPPSHEWRPHQRPMAAADGGAAPTASSNGTPSHCNGCSTINSLAATVTIPAAPTPRLYQAQHGPHRRPRRGGDFRSLQPIIWPSRW